MDAFLVWLSNNPIAIVVGLLVLGVIILVIFVIALLRGCEIIIEKWKITIRPRPDTPTEVHPSENHQEVITPDEQKFQKVITLAPNGFGLQHIWIRREYWERDAVHGLEAWRDLVCKAKEVDILSNTFYARWMYEDDFRKKFFSRIADEHNPLKARILIYHPGSAIVRLRAAQEKDKPNQDTEMIHEINSMLRDLADQRKRLPLPARANLEVRLNVFFYQLAQIIRADDQMVVATYLTRRSGTPSPAFQILRRGTEYNFYNTYQEQFKALWGPDKIYNDKINIPLGDAEWDSILNTGTLSLSAADDPVLRLLCPPPQ